VTFDTNTAVYDLYCIKKMDQDNNNNTGNGNGDENNETNARNVRAKLCANCFKALERRRLCSKCHTAAYCDQACQRSHWPKHKKLCEKSDDDDYEKLANNYNNQGKC